MSVAELLVQAVAQQILETAKAGCQSRTLRDALKAEIEGGLLRLSVPHYWAPFFERGRGSISARPGHKLVFYRNPADDPRLANGFPVRLSDVRRLTKEEFYRDLKAGRLIVKNSVGPAPPHEFMGQALTLRAQQLVALTGPPILRQAVRDALGSLMNVTVTTTI